MMVNYSREATRELAEIYFGAAPEDRTLITESSDAADRVLADAPDDFGDPLLGHPVEGVIQAKLADRIPAFRWPKLPVIVVRSLFFVASIENADETVTIYAVGRRRVPLKDI